MKTTERADGTVGAARRAKVVRVRRNGVLLEELGPTREGRPVCDRLLAWPCAGLRPGDVVEILPDPYGKGHSLCWFALPSLTGCLGFVLGRWLTAAAAWSAGARGVLLPLAISGAGFCAGLLWLYGKSIRTLGRRYAVRITDRVVNTPGEDPGRL